MRPETRVGYDYVHAIVDDHSRLAFIERHDDETAAAVTGFVARALADFAARGISVRRLMTDNAFAYVKNRSLRELLAAQASAISPPGPTDPAPTGRWSASTRPWPANRPTATCPYHSHHHRTAALPHWLDHDNTRRPHSSIGDRPPISRVHNVRG